MYKLIKDVVTDTDACVFRVSDNTCIPFNPDNTDYQAYLKWLSEGNEPLPPDAPATE